jgi:hypothetical protein
MGWAFFFSPQRAEADSEGLKAYSYTLIQREGDEGRTFGDARVRLDY